MKDKSVCVLMTHSVFVYIHFKMPAFVAFYTVKKVIVLPVPNRDVINQTLLVRELLNYFWPGGEFGWGREKR
jgi:hypothetical protein